MTPIRVKLGNYVVLIVAILGIIGSVLVGALYSGNFASPQLADNVDGNSLHQLHSADAATLPMVVEDHFKLNGLFGDAKIKPQSLKIFDNGIVDPDRHCEFCTLLRYTPGSIGVAGAAYSIDGTNQGKLDLSGAKRVHLFVMGDEGGEKIRLEAAGKEVNTPKNNVAKNASSVAYALTSNVITWDAGRNGHFCETGSESKLVVGVGFCGSGSRRRSGQCRLDSQAVAG